MSLINKMLQDLEERKSGAELAGNWQGQVRAAPEPRTRRLHWLVILGLVAALGAVAGAGLWWMSARQSPQHATPPARIVVPPPALGLKMDHLPPVADKVPLPESSVATADPVTPELTETSTQPEAVESANAEESAKPQKSAMNTATALPQPASATPRPAERAASKRAAPPGPAPVASPTESGQQAAALPDSALGEGIVPVKISKQIRELTPAQRAENEYRRALTMIEQGKSREAAGVLEQALQIDLRHAAARQTLAALLIDGKRTDEAIRILNEGLSADRTQIGSAMMLARLQVDRQDVRAAIETLQLSLRHAEDRADYRAFLAALLQRESRHKEAVDHYLAALKKSPNNGLWWMGIGISLQAENRIPDARDAFHRARSSGALSPELQAFVEQRLSQLR